MLNMRSVLIAILLGGLMASTLDIGAAAPINGRSPAVILQFIASGLIGSGPLAGGTGTVFLGLLLQWLMGVTIAAVYVLASLRFPLFTRRRDLSTS